MATTTRLRAMNTMTSSPTLLLCQGNVDGAGGNEHCWTLEGRGRFGKGHRKHAARDFNIPHIWGAWAGPFTHGNSNRDGTGAARAGFTGATFNDAHAHPAAFDALFAVSPTRDDELNIRA